MKKLTQAQLAVESYDIKEIAISGNVRAFNSIEEICQALNFRGINEDVLTRFEDGSILIKYELMQSRIELIKNTHNSTVDILNEVQANLRRNYPLFVKGAA